MARGSNKCLHCGEFMSPAAHTCTPSSPSPRGGVAVAAEPTARENTVEARVAKASLLLEEPPGDEAPLQVRFTDAAQSLLEAEAASRLLDEWGAKLGEVVRQDYPNGVLVNTAHGTVLVEAHPDVSYSGWQHDAILTDAAPVIAQRTGTTEEAVTAVLTESRRYVTPTRYSSTQLTAAGLRARDYSDVTVGVTPRLVVTRISKDSEDASPDTSAGLAVRVQRIMSDRRLTGEAALQSYAEHRAAVNATRQAAVVKGNQMAYEIVYSGEPMGEFSATHDGYDAVVAPAGKPRLKWNQEVTWEALRPAIADASGVSDDDTIKVLTAYYGRDGLARISSFRKRDVEAAGVSVDMVAATVTTPPKLKITAVG